jgi:hypothetical protein
MALAGVVFALLFATSLALVRSVFPEALHTDFDWYSAGAGRIAIAITIMPFAGIAFLYLIGVLRDTFGDAEDKVFSSVFLGSGILFLAMVFVAMGIAGALLTTIEADLSEEESVIAFGRAVMLQISNVYALRMAAVFMISLATLWFRTGALPKWVSFVTYFVAAVLLFVVSFSLWVTMIFPAWAFAVSVYLLIRNYRMRPLAHDGGS